MKRFYAAIFAFTLPLMPYLADVACAQSPGELMNSGNEAYRAGDYSTATDFYEGIKTENADLYYNKGNAYFKNGNRGMSILNYRRALRINPRDADARSNLQHARAVRQDKIEVKPESLSAKILKTPYRFISMNENAGLSLVWFTLLTITLFALVGMEDDKTAKKLKAAAQLAAILLLLQALNTGIKTYAEKWIDSGVVVSKSATAFSAPSDDSDKLFVLHDGAEVVLERSENGYSLIILPTGWSGWIAKTAVEKI